MGIVPNNHQKNNYDEQKDFVLAVGGGTGMKITEHYSAGQRKYCATCGKTVGTGHMHVRCDMCNGTGNLNY